MNPQVTQSTFLGDDGVHQIYYTVYTPEKPKAVLQIIHGMAEYFGRYDGFARFMANAGYIVCGEDHLGHGRTGDAVKEFGYYGDNNQVPGEARNHMVNDVHLLTLKMQEQYPDLPYVIMGHSMGSMLCRMYLSLYGTDVDAAIVMGTCGTSGSSKIAGLGAKICGIVGACKGKKHISKLVIGMAFGTYNDRFKDEHDGFSWLTKDKASRDLYRKDPWAGFPFTVSAFRSMMELIQFISRKAWFYEVPADLPVLLISGSDDPVGNYGQGVKEVLLGLNHAGKTDVDMKLYDGDRHEILNEADRDQVYQDLLDWTDSHLI